jgi:ATP-dependent DNA helicase RecG
MRLAYDELLANQLALALARRMEQRQKSYPIRFDAALEKKWRSALPFTLTQGQENILADIRADMGAGTRMVRLLQGDVGSGKTILAFAAMAQAVGSGLQACLMAPTDLLARQHMETLPPHDRVPRRR